MPMNPMVMMALATMASAGSNFLGRPKQGAQSKRNPQEQNMINQVMQAMQGKGGSMEGMYGKFDPTSTMQGFQTGFADPAMKMFKEQIAPGISEQFTGTGRHSGVDDLIQQAGEGVQSDLSSQMAKMLMSGQQDHQNRQGSFLQQLLGSPSQVPTQTQGTGGPLGSVMPYIFEMIGSKMGQDTGGAGTGGPAVTKNLMDSLKSKPFSGSTILAGGGNMPFGYDA